ncbi:RICIN domain-containing protein [Streptomyces sp. NPDC051162]|uniref:RICIN domain-containing protein n=1 Tax=unclassified Streptomyces TaxID=2593676 RepID=UPI003414D2E3
MKGFKLKIASKITTAAAAASVVMLMTPGVSHADNPYWQLGSGGAGKCLEIENSSSSNGARAQQWSCGSQTGSYWKFRNRGDGWYSLENFSGKCLEVADSRTDNGAPVQQWSCAGNDTQEWKFSTGAGHYGNFALVNRNSGKVLEVENSSTANGARVQQWDFADTPGQGWSAGQVG